jgi:hypothetical protein
LGDELNPQPGNSDASYTWETYDLNDPRKIELRRKRRESIEVCIALADRESIRALHDKLLSRAFASSDPVLIEAAVETARKLWEAHGRARKDLRQFAAIPRDADGVCRCHSTGGHSLNTVLDEQTLEVDLD